MAGTGREEGRTAAGARMEECRAAAARLAVEGRGRREVDLTYGPHMSGPRLGRVIVIWTSREPINNFRDSELYFWEFGTAMTQKDKFRDPSCILLFFTSCYILAESINIVSCYNV